MKKLVFVIQLIFLYSGLAMADPVISLKTLLHEMTDRSVLARWPENAYTCKQFSSYDRSSHNMTDKRAWFGWAMPLAVMMLPSCVTFSPV